jgi:hypothetical protein
VGETGGIDLGRFTYVGLVERAGQRAALLELVTPLPAEPYDRELRPKAPPVMFDRTAAGELIVPGRWWHHLFERLAGEPRLPDAWYRLAAPVVARRVEITDALLPADTDTIALAVPDDAGHLVLHEALKPGTRMTVPVWFSAEAAP